MWRANGAALNPQSAASVCTSQATRISLPRCQENSKQELISTLQHFARALKSADNWKPKSGWGNRK